MHSRLYWLHVGLEYTKFAKSFFLKFNREICISGSYITHMPQLIRKMTSDRSSWLFPLYIHCIHWRNRHLQISVSSLAQVAIHDTIHITKKEQYWWVYILRQQVTFVCSDVCTCYYKCNCSLFENTFSISKVRN